MTVRVSSPLGHDGASRKVLPRLHFGTLPSGLRFAGGECTSSLVCRSLQPSRSQPRGQLAKGLQIDRGYGRLVVEDKIGSGAMGTVYRGRAIPSLVGSYVFGGIIHVSGIRIPRRIIAA